MDTPPGLLSRYFRCGFRTTFSGVLQRVFSGIASIKKYEITMIRRYYSDNDDDFEDCSESENNGTCFIAEFNLQIDISGKMQNSRTLKESLNEAMIDLRKDSSLIIKPKARVPILTKFRNYENERKFERVRILQSSKVKIAGQNAVPFAAVTLTILLLTYK